MTPLPVSERELQDTLLDAAQRFGWRRVHFRPGMNRRGDWATPLEGDPGFPDLVLCKPPRLIFAELKGPRGRVAPDQRMWLDDLRACPGLEVYTWWPADLDRALALLARAP